MIDGIRTDESIQVLVFVCVPLLLVLVAIVVLLTRGPRYSAKFPTFSVTITKIGREEAYVMYRDRNKDVEFAAQIGRGKPLLCRRYVCEYRRNHQTKTWATLFQTSPLV